MEREIYFEVVTREGLLVGKGSGGPIKVECEVMWDRASLTKKSELYVS
jgi:hypothetical protein